MIHETKESSTGSTVEDDTDRNLLSMFDKYLNGQLKHLDDFDEDDDEFNDEEAKDCMNDSVNQFTSNYFQSARKHRDSKSRRSSVFGNLLNSSRSKSSYEVVQLLRHYYEEERNQSMLSSFAETKVELPIDFEALSVDSAVEEVFKLKDEIDEMKRSAANQIAENHKNDLEQLVKLLHDQKKKIMMKSSQTELDEEPVNSEVQDLTMQFLCRVKTIKELQSVARDKLQDLETLQSVGKFV